MRGRIDQRQSSAAVADHRKPIARVDANIVGIIAERDSARRGKVRGLEQPDRSVARVGDQDDIGTRRIADTLRLAQSGEPMQRHTGDDIDDVNRVVAEFGDDEPLASRVECHVIDPAAHVVQRNGLLQHQRLRGLSRQRQQQREPNRAHHVS